MAFANIAEPKSTEVEPSAGPTECRFKCCNDLAASDGKRGEVKAKEARDATHDFPRCSEER